MEHDMAAIEIINSGMLKKALQDLPDDMVVVIDPGEGPGVHGCGVNLLRAVEIRDYYQGNQSDKTLLVDPATTACDGRKLLKVLCFSCASPIPMKERNGISG
jgi:hypothetical protein